MSELMKAFGSEDNVMVFENSTFGNVRVIEENGKTLFCGSDVAKALGYSRPADAVTQHCKGSVKRRLPTAGGMQETKFITEGDVYRLVTHSKLPTAERFESWVFDEVIPSIRKHGAYLTPENTEQGHRRSPVEHRPSDRSQGGAREGLVSAGGERRSEADARRGRAQGQIL